MPRGAKPGERRGGRAKGTKNRATIEKELLVKTALDGIKDEVVARSVLSDAISEVRDLMAKHHPDFGKKPNEPLYFKYCTLLRSLASDLIGYQAPKLTAVKVGGDRDNPLLISEGRTGLEIRQELLELIAQGYRPTKLGTLKPPPTIEGVANIAGKNGGGSG